MSSCRGGPYSMQFSIKSANITKNQLKVDGEVVIPDTQSKDLLIVLKYRRCEMTNNKKCGKNLDYVLPKVCSLVSEVGSVFGIRFNKAFSPKWDCPVKANTYKIHVNISLKGILRIPLTNLRYETKLVFQESGKKKPLGCVEGVYWLKENN